MHINLGKSKGLLRECGRFCNEGFWGKASDKNKARHSSGGSLECFVGKHRACQGAEGSSDGMGSIPRPVAASPRVPRIPVTPYRLA